jgi:hypothetical protein
MIDHSIRRRGAYGAVAPRSALRPINVCDRQHDEFKLQTTAMSSLLAHNRPLGSTGAAPSLTKPKETYRHLI